MTDPKLENAPILRQTLCHVGCHVFVSAGSVRGAAATPDHHLCTCGAYYYAEWRRIQEETK